jgi:hypothetical protein
LKEIRGFDLQKPVVPRVSWKRSLIISLRQRYRDLIHPLSSLELELSGATVRAEYVDAEGLDRKGAFRVHPSLPTLQLWPDMEAAYEHIRSLARSDEAIIRNIEQLRRVREAEEAVTKARSRGKPPRREDWEVIQEARAQPIRLRTAPVEGEESSLVTLQEIGQAVASRRADILQRSGVLPKEPVRVPLRPDAPVRLRSKISIRLIVQFDQA